MRLRFPLRNGYLLTILVAAMLAVGLACSSDEATNTPPAATATATAEAMATATATSEPTATFLPGVPTPTVTNTPLPTALPGENLADLKKLPGYNPAWGEPQVGGVMKLGNPGTTSSLFRPPCHAAVGGTTCGPIYQTLMRDDPWQGQKFLTGDLAKSWEFSSDGLTLTFQLQEGVFFHDNPAGTYPDTYNGGIIRGDEFVCEDVVASMWYALDPPEVKRSPHSKYLPNIGDITCPDGARGSTVEMHLTQVLAKTLKMMVREPAMLDKDWIAWYSETQNDAMGDMSAASFMFAQGTGPMMPAELQIDQVAKIVRNPNHWKPGLPLLDGMESFWLKDFSTRFAALATGQINWFGAGSSSLLSGQLEQIQRDFSDRINVNHFVHGFPSGGVYLNLNRAPFNDRRVRQALFLAVDREEWLLFRTAGDTVMSRLSSHMGPDSFFWWGNSEEEIRTWPGFRQPHDQDVVEANRLLDEALGAGNRFDTECVTRTAQNYKDWCLFLADQWKGKLGIDMTLRPVETVVLTGLSNACDWSVQGGPLATSRGDPDDRLVQYSRAYNQGLADECSLNGIEAAETELQLQIQDMIAEQTGLLDQQARLEILLEMDKLLTLDLIEEIMLGWSEIFYGTTQNVRGYALNTFANDHYPIFERVWLNNQ